MAQTKQTLIKSIDKFSMDFPEWEDYKLELQEDGTVKVKNNSEVITSVAAKELIRDFEVILKQNGLMVTTFQKDHFTVDEYTYEVEDGMDELADELEYKFGKYFSNLKVMEKDNKPYVSFSFIGSLTKSEKDKVKQDIKNVMKEYEFADEEDIFAEVEFDDLDEILEKINQEDLEDDLDEYIKAEDDFIVNDVIIVTERNKDFILAVERDLDEAIANGDKERAQQCYNILFRIDYEDFQRRSAELDELIERLPKREKQIENMKSI